MTFNNYVVKANSCILHFRTPLRVRARATVSVKLRFLKSSITKREGYDSAIAPLFRCEYVFHETWIKVLTVLKIS